MRQRLALILGLAGTSLLVLSATPITAQAEAPVRVGWWNAASGNGAAAPSPSTPSGGIRVSAGPGGTTPVPGVSASQAQVLAYGALLYEADEGTTGTLTLKVAGTAQGTPQVVACPTSTNVWTTGDDQPAPGPAYNCNAGHFPGTVSAAGDTVTFHVTAEFESDPGELSLAIVPDLSSTALPTGPSPFAVDFSPPDAASFSSEGGAGASGSSFLPAYVPPPPAGAPLGLPALSAPPAVPAQPPPAASAPAPKPAAAPPARPAPISTALVLRSRIATAIGLLCLLVAVLLWSLGFGLMGGRVIPLSVPLKRV